MKTAEKILDRARAMGFTLSRHGDKIRLTAPAGGSPPPDLDRAIRTHKEELLNYLASHEGITREQYEALTPEQRQYWQPATGKKQTLTWEESGRLIEEGTTFPELGSFEYETDRLLFESSRRLAQAWPKGFDLDDDLRWQQSDKELHVAYQSGDPEKLRMILELRELLAIKLFEAYRKERAA